MRDDLYQRVLDADPVPKLGPRNEKERVIFVQEGFRVNLQQRIYANTRNNKLVIYDSEWNPTLRELAVLFDELGLVFEVKRKQ